MIPSRYVQACLMAVSEEYSIPVTWLKSRGRTAKVSEARKIFWLVLRVSTGAKDRELGHCLLRHRTTTRDALNKIIIWLRVYPSLQMVYDRIVTRFLQLI